MKLISGKHKLNKISKTVADTTLLLLQLSIMNLKNCIHDAEYLSNIIFVMQNPSLSSDAF
jgi:hypothetical protein